jgi:hypothetical protein
LEVAGLRRRRAAGRRAAIGRTEIEREREWTAGIDLDAVIAENHRLHGEVTRLRILLRRHGIEPNGDTAQTA